MCFGRFRVWFEKKAAKIDDFAHLNVMFRHYNISKLAYISRTDTGTNIQAPLLHKTNQFDQI